MYQSRHTHLRADLLQGNLHFENLLVEFPFLCFVYFISFHFSATTTNAYRVVGVVITITTAEMDRMKKAALHATAASPNSGAETVVVSAARCAATANSIATIGATRPTATRQAAKANTVSYQIQLA